MKKILLLLLTLNPLITIGQSLVSIKGGINFTNVNYDNFYKDNSSRIGLLGGFGYEQFFGDKYSFGVDLVYNQRGFKNNSYFSNDQGNSTGQIPAVKFFYDYISIPIKAGINFGQKFNGFGNIGIMPSFLTKAVTTIPTVDMNGQVTGKESFNVTDKVTKFDFAGLIEIGLNYKLREQYWIFTSFLFQNSFTTITNNDYFKNSEIKHYGLTLSFGLKYKLTKHN